MFSLDDYDYEIEEKSIAKNPSEPRDHAKLFVYDSQKDEIHFDKFYRLSHYLPENSLMVLNNTGVIPARTQMKKDTGGTVEIFFLINEGIQDDGTIPVIVNKNLHLGRKVFLNEYCFVVSRQKNQYFYLLPEFDIEKLTTILLEYGTTPTPKYLGKIDMSEGAVRARYQTIFAEEKKSVAAPTASLHFTEKVFESLRGKKIERTEVTLHVGMGTFATVTSEQIENKKLHLEPIQISEGTRKKIFESKANKKPIIAVGTTAIRTLESSADWLHDTNSSGDLQTTTQLFIMPGFQFQVADILITNFHVPKSSLMSLVDCFLKHKKAKKNILELYKLALENEFRFFSFGDSMLIL